jgi:hypothetical protein
MRRSALLLAAAVLVLAACAKPKAQVVSLYDRTPVPAVPDRTATVADPLADGIYWAGGLQLRNNTLVFTLTQAFFGATCTTELGADACANDFGVLDTRTATVTIAPGDLVSVTVVDAAQKNYAVTGAELATLVGGGKPAASAPADYRYIADPFLVTLAGGRVVEAEQVWVP